MLPDLDPSLGYRINPGPSPFAARALISPYALSVDLGQGNFLEIGRFSLSMLMQLDPFVGPDEGVVFRCGAFCEPSMVDILIGGEHDNGGLWNVTMGGENRLFQMFGEAGGTAPTRPTVIGDNVVLSKGAMVLSGVTIGDGAVIGARAVVTRDCEPFGIYAGVPAKKLSERFGPERQALYRAMRLPELHAHHVPRMAGLARRLESGELTLEGYLSQVSFLTAKPKLHFTGSKRAEGVCLDKLVGASIDGQAVDAATFQRIADYVNQDGSKEFDWRPDIFHAMGLC